MVTQSTVDASNARISTELPAGMTAVFIGGTSGLGEMTLMAFAKHAKAPSVIFVGRNVEAGNRIQQACRNVNTEGSFTFIPKDTSLLRNVDELCETIKASTDHINLLVLSTGTLDFKSKTEEGLNKTLALLHYTRMRFIHNLLPSVQAAPGLKRVFSIATGGKEGPIVAEGISDVDKVSFGAARGHMSSLKTLSMEHLAKSAPSVSFVHSFPGWVKTGIARDITGFLGFFVRVVVGTYASLFLNIPPDRAAAYSLYLATSARYPPKEVIGNNAGVVRGEDVGVAKGTDGGPGSGMYTVSENGDDAGCATHNVLQPFRMDGTAARVTDDLSIRGIVYLVVRRLPS